jgi:hypothetical protein
VMVNKGESIPFRYGEAVEASEDATSSLIIEDAVLKSISSSLVASLVHGATCSSESRVKSRSLPLAIVDRAERGAASAPPSRGTRYSGSSPAPTLPRSVVQSQGVPTPVT